MMTLPSSPLSHHPSQGRLDHVLDGVFENYLTVRGSDPMMAKVLARVITHYSMRCIISVLPLCLHLSSCHVS